VHIPSSFQQADRQEIHTLIQRYPFATLVLHDSRGLSAYPLPLQLIKTASTTLLHGHVAKNNPLAQAAGVNVLVIFQGPNGYISPSWYPSKKAHGKAVPTWNHLTVQAHGSCSSINDINWLERHLQQLSSAQEAAFSYPWKVEDAPLDYRQKMLQAITGIEIEVQRFEAQWKLSQNRSSNDQLGVLADLQQSPDCQHQQLADWFARTNQLPVGKP